MDDYQKCVYILFNLRDSNTPITPNTVNKLVSVKYFRVFLENLAIQKCFKVGLSPSIWDGELTDRGNKFITSEYLNLINLLQSKKQAKSCEHLERFGVMVEGDSQWLPDKLYTIFPISGIWLNSTR